MEISPIYFMKAFKVFICVLLVFVMSVTCFAASTYDFLYVSTFDSADYTFVLLDNYVNVEPIYLYPGVNYYLTLTVDSSLFDYYGGSYRVFDDHGDPFILINSVNGVMLDTLPAIDINYFDPAHGGNSRTYRITVSERVVLDNVTNNDAVNASFFVYDGQTAVVDAGNGVMSVLTSFINECMLHWNLLLFCIVLPIIGFAVSIVISFRERRKEN